MRDLLGILLAVVWVALCVVTCLGLLTPEPCSVHDVVFNPQACEKS